MIPAELYCIASLCASSPSSLTVELPTTSPTDIVLDVGLTAEVMATCGAETPSLQAMTSAIVAHGELVEAWMSARAASDAAHQALEESLASASGGASVPAIDAASLAAAEAAAAAALAHLALVECILTPLSSAERSTALALMAAAARRVSPEFRVLSLDGAGWTTLELALIAEARATRLGEPVPTETALFLSSVRSEPAVAAAAQSLIANLSGWREAMAASGSSGQ
jgi:hypothetical protein